MQQEISRLSTLKSLDILDTDPDTRFDRLTRIAKRMFNVPIAVVSLVDEDRQWFKSRVGLDVSETAREISFCQHTIKDDKPYIVEDAKSCELFSNNPLVIEQPFIRFYAGIPLKAINGNRLGTLCVIDQKEREFSQEDIKDLSDLAGVVERELNIIELAMYDDLTMLLNRRGFIDRTTESLKLCKRYNVSTSLIYIDLDNFKEINDNLGHREGDKALKIFANTIRESFRDTDICARIGGDEFVLLLHNTNKNSCETIIKSFQITLKKNYYKENTSFELEFSYGVLEIGADTVANIETLLHQSDINMYKHKVSKRA